MAHVEGWARTPGFGRGPRPQVSARFRQPEQRVAGVLDGGRLPAGSAALGTRNFWGARGAKALRKNESSLGRPTPQKAVQGERESISSEEEKRKDWTEKCPGPDRGAAFWPARRWREGSSGRRAARPACDEPPGGAEGPTLAAPATPAARDRRPVEHGVHVRAVTPLGRRGGSASPAIMGESTARFPLFLHRWGPAARWRAREPPTPRTCPPW